LSIAFAIAEQLQASAASTMFVTHYPQITSLAAMYPNVKNVHMRTSLDIGGSGGASSQTAANTGKDQFRTPVIAQSYLIIRCYYRRSDEVPARGGCGTV